MKVKFYLSRPEAKTESSVIVSVAYSKQRFKLPVGESINPRFWNAKKHEARQTPSFPESPEFNARLQWIESQINKTYLRFKNNNEGLEPESDVLKKEINTALGRDNKTRLGFIGYFKNFIYRQKEGLRINAKGGIINPDDSKHYQHTLNSITGFKADIDFKDVSLNFYNDYIQYLNKQNVSLNTVGSHIKRLKAVLNEAKAGGYPVNSDYESKYFSKQAEEAENIALTPEELEAMQNLDLSNVKRLEAVRDLFLVGCHTGLRYSDFSRLTAANIRSGFIIISQQKTGNPVVIPVHPVVAEIIERYGDALPKSISNQKTNDFLKEICKKITLLEATECKFRSC